jgi:tetratricopeptide (TPR) repeat protein
MVLVAVGLVGAADEVVGPSHDDAGTGRGQEAPPLGIELRRVELWREPVPTVRLHTTRPIAPRVIALAADGRAPARLRIEVPARVAARKLIGGFGAVGRVVVERARRDASVVTIELAADVGHRVRRDGRLTAIELVPRPSAVAGTEPEPPVPAPAVAPLRLAALVAEAPTPAMTPAEPPAKFAMPTAPGGAAVPAPAQPERRDAVIAIERGARFVWPDLDAPCYADPGAAVERLALKGWRQGGMTPDAPAHHSSAAGRYLAADVTFLRTLMGQLEPLEAIVAYERALRKAPDFPDAPRALVMVGFASLRLGLAPEADTAFGRALREHPQSRYTIVATIGRAAALRARQRLDDARAVLAAVGDDVPARLRCDVLSERAAIAREARMHAEAVGLDETLARECPQLDQLPTTVSDRVESLLAVGRRADARALLARPIQDLDAEAQAKLWMRSAELAREDGDLHSARTSLDRALGARIGPATRVAVQARLARLDAAVNADRAIAMLQALDTNAPTLAGRADVLGLVAETLSEAGRFDEALARLAIPPHAVGGVVDTILGHRDAVLARWIARLTAAGDTAGVVTVYARHRTPIDTRASAATARQVASALARASLHGAAVRVLRLRDSGADPGHALAIADTALDGGDAAVARDVLDRLDAATLPDDLVAARARLLARLAAIEGRPEEIAALPDAARDVVLARDLALAWLGRGDAEAAREDWIAAAQAYERARTIAPDGATRLVATARLVAVRTAAGQPVDPATDDLAAIDDPLVRRGVELLAATRAFGTTLAATPAEEGADGR